MNDFQDILDYIVKNESKKTVGMSLKRIELALEDAKKENRNYLTDKELEKVKDQIREVIYEQYRNLKDFLNTGKLIIKINNA